MKVNRILQDVAGQITKAIADQVEKILAEGREAKYVFLSLDHYNLLALATTDEKLREGKYMDLDILLVDGIQVPQVIADFDGQFDMILERRRLLTKKPENPIPSKK